MAELVVGMHPERIGAYLLIRRHPDDPRRRTGVWDVLGLRGDVLGIIRWFGRWRQYSFDPRAGTTFNDACLRDIADVLERLNREHRAAKAAERATS